MVVRNSDIETGVVAAQQSNSVFALWSLGCLYMAISTCLVMMNKYLMTEDRFPYAVPLVTLHQGSISVFSIILYTLAPKLYPTMEMVGQNKWLAFKLLLPLAACCAGTFVFSNMAYTYVSVALLQIMKEGNVAGVYVLSLATGLNVWRPKVALVLFFIVICASAAISGDIHFKWIGIYIQIASQGFECCKLIITQFTMSDRPGAALGKLDPMTAVGLVSPLCFLLLAMACAYWWEDAWVPAFVEWKLMLLVNCFVAFALNLSIFKLVQISSGIQLVLFGVMKDVFIVSASSWIFAEPLTVFQGLCFAAILFLIFIHANMGFHKSAYDEGWGSGLSATFNFQSKQSAQADAKERQPILSSK